MSKVVLITGANVGIGKDCARQLALRGDVGKIYLGCRNATRAAEAQKDLEQRTGKTIFEVLIVDVSDLDSVRAAVAKVNQPIDRLIMNAGGMVGATAMQKTSYGVTEMTAVNLLGHVLLLESLLERKLLREVAIFLGSEASVGVPKMGIKAPIWSSGSVDEFTSALDGSFCTNNTKPDPMLHYGQVKYVGTLWMAHLARSHPSIKFLTISPGSTKGTQAAASLPPVLRFVVNYIANPIILPLLGMAHSLETGTARIVAGVDSPGLKSGHFYASKKGHISGPVVDQGDIIPDVLNTRYQDNASEAIHKFISA
ncbi:hypothetical protein HDU89_008279 [Geranomyces variabilis]|nr:hypothetical protein HDU89_008279 [Geranomyces variabilis]